MVATGCWPRGCCVARAGVTCARVPAAEINYRPPWGKMLVLAGAGLALIVVGLTVGSAVLAFLGALFLGAAPVGLMVPALRIARARRLDPRPWRGYSDQNDFLGAMHLLGFKSEDFEWPWRRTSEPEPPPEDERASSRQADEHQR